jgi:hypothetical protein
MFRQIMLKSAFGIIFTVIAAPAFAQNGGGGGGGGNGGDGGGNAGVGTKEEILAIFDKDQQKKNRANNTIPPRYRVVYQEDSCGGSRTHQRCNQPVMRYQRAFYED